MANDVLHLHLAGHRESATYAEETDAGFLLLRRQDTDDPVGLTVVNSWRRFGRDAIPDSIRELECSIEPWVTRIAA